MCNNRFSFNSPESEYYRFLGECAAMVLQKKPLQEIADEKGLTVDDLLSKLEGIQKINPALYKQIQDMKDNL